MIDASMRGSDTRLMTHVWWTTARMRPSSTTLPHLWVLIATLHDWLVSIAPTSLIPVSCWRSSLVHGRTAKSSKQITESQASSLGRKQCSEGLTQHRVQSLRGIEPHRRARRCHQMARPGPGPSGILVLLLSRMEMRLVMMRVVVLLLLMIRPVGLRTIYSPLTMQCMPLKALVWLLQSLSRTLYALIHEKRESLRLPSLLIEPQGTVLNLPIPPKVFEQLVGIDLSRHIAHKDLALSVFRDRWCHGRWGRHGPRGGKLAGGGAISDLLLGLPKGLAGPAPVLEEDESVALGFARDAVGDGLAVLDLAVLAEDGD